MKGGIRTNIQGDFKQDIPQYEIESLARLLLPEIQKFFEKAEAENKEEFEAWQKRNELK